MKNNSKKEKAQTDLFRDVWENIKRSNMGNFCPRDQGKNMFEEIVAEDFSDMVIQ